MLAATLVAACAEPRPAQPTAALERDSAGVRIVENSVPALSVDSAWTISAEPIVEIGSNEQDSSQILFRVMSMVRLNNGQIVIANTAPPMVRWFDESGGFLHGTGRPGDGPGEFSGEGGFIDAIWPLPADSIGTWDALQRRMQVFDAQGHYTRSVTLQNIRADEPLGALLGRLANGEFVSASTLDEEQPAGAVLIRHTMVVVRWSATGARIANIASLPGITNYAREYWTARVGWSGVTDDGPPPPPPPQPPFVPFPATWAAGDRLYYGSADRYEIAVYDTAGHLTMLIRAAQPRRAVTRAHIDAREARLKQRLPSGSLRAGYIRLIEGGPYPDSLPPYDGILVDREGAIWVRDYQAPGDTVAGWSVFDSDGRWLTKLQLPARLYPRDIGRDYVLALGRDSLDIETVRMYRLARTGVSHRNALTRNLNRGVP